ncbi:hypothetical protein TNCV_2704511 [Trichonephila clavipes]|nr:hypothetical protein TNCV_2704511 [Trichonephila clavipes]
MRSVHDLCRSTQKTKGRVSQIKTIPMIPRQSCPVNNLNSATAGETWQVSSRSLENIRASFLLKGPPFHFPKGHNGKAPTGRQPLLGFCLAAPCNPGLGSFCLGCLPRPELQPYQERRDEQKADEGPNGPLVSPS